MSVNKMMKKGKERGTVRQIRWIAGSIILSPYLSVMRTEIFLTILSTFQESRYHLVSCVAKGFAVESTASPSVALDPRHFRLSLNQRDQFRCGLRRASGANDCSTFLVGSYRGVHEYGI